MLRKSMITLKGLSPLLMNAFPSEEIPNFKNLPKDQQAEHSAYRDKDNELYVPGVAVQRALINAAVYTKGKGRASAQKSAAACMMVDPDKILLGLKEYVIDSRPVVVPATKGRIVRHRPKVENWKIKFTLEWDDELLSEEKVREIVNNMGKRVGLLDFRPEKKGPFGRCEVSKWENI